MSTAGRCMALNTSSGTVVGPGMARNSRPALTTISRSFEVTNSPSVIGGRPSAVKRTFGPSLTATAGPDMLVGHDGRRAMLYRVFIASIALAIAWETTTAGAQAIDSTKFPDWKGQWVRIGGGGQYGPRHTAGGGQQPARPAEEQ